MDKELLKKIQSDNPKPFTQEEIDQMPKVDFEARWKLTGNETFEEALNLDGTFGKPS